MINLSCPKCETELEIDDGFAGGICRCFDCGTLMTVPAKANGRAEMLTRARPKRPGAPGEPPPSESADRGRADQPSEPPKPRPGRPASPTEPAPEPRAAGAGADKPGAAEPTTPEPSTPQARPEAKAEAEGAGEAGVEAGGATTLVTASGREVRVTEDQLDRVAVAQRRRVGIRAGALVLIIVVVGGLTAAAVVLGLNLLQSIRLEEQKNQQVDNGNDPNTDPIDIEDVLAFDPARNPYRMTTPNVMGLPIDADRETTLAIIVDASYSMTDFYGHVSRLLPISVETLTGGPPVQLWLARADLLRRAGAGEGAGGEGPLDRQAAAAMLADAEDQIAGQQKLADAVADALDTGGAGHIVMICHFKPTGEDLDAIASAVESADAKLDIIQLGKWSASFEQFADSIEGRYIDISESMLDQWRAESINPSPRDNGGGDQPGDADPAP